MTFQVNDGTQDVVSKKDPQAVLLRYVTVQDFVVSPVERLIEVFATGDSSDKGLCDFFPSFVRIYE